MKLLFTLSLLLTASLSHSKMVEFIKNSDHHRGGLGIHLSCGNDGLIYSAGSYTPPGQDKRTWGVRKSKDYGKTWELVDTYRAPSDQYAMATAITATNDGKIYVAGTQGPVLFNCKMIIRRSLDGGTTWEQSAEILPEVEGSCVYPEAAASDAKGNIYVFGSMNIKKPQSRAVLWHSADQGKTWTALKNFQYLQDKPTQGLKMAIDGEGGILLTGNAYAPPKRPDISSTNRGYVLLSRDFGNTWSQIEDYPSPDLELGHLSTISINFSQNGKSIVSVYGATDDRSKSPAYWAVRESKDDGKTWTNLDHFLPETYGATAAFDVAELDIGELLAVGVGVTKEGKRFGLARFSRDGGKSWETVHETPSAIGGSFKSVCANRPSTYAAFTGWFDFVDTTQDPPKEYEEATTVVLRKP